MPFLGGCNEMVRDIKEPLRKDMDYDHRHDCSKRIKHPRGRTFIIGHNSSRMPYARVFPLDWMFILSRLEIYILKLDVWVVFWICKLDIWDAMFYVRTCEIWSGDTMFISVFLCLYKYYLWRLSFTMLKGMFAIIAKYDQCWILLWSNSLQ